MILTERFEVYKYNGGKKEEKQNSFILGEKKKTFHFGESVPEVMPQIAKKMYPGASQPGQREKRARGAILVGLMGKRVARKRKSKVINQ